MSTARPDLEEGYPLRDEALGEPSEPAGGTLESTQPFAPSFVEPPPVRTGRRFSRALLALLGVALVAAGVGAAYVLTHRAHGRRLEGPAPAAASPATSLPSPGAPAAPPTTAPAAPPTSTAAAPDPRRVAVPRVVGEPLPYAVSTLRQAGLLAIVSHVVSTQPNGSVVGQRPDAGATLGKGARVRLEVSLQPPVVVPDVTGIRLLYARQRLTAAHLLVSVRYVPSTQPARRVIAQYPRAGTKVKRGGHELVNVSTGVRPSPSSTATAVPDVVGEDQATATADLQAAGFGVDVVESPTSDPGQDGMVVDQTPSAGAKASRDSRVTISVGRFSNG